MASKTVAQLRAKFETGDTPTAQDFVDLIDSFLHAQLGNFPNPLPAVSGEKLLNVADALPNPLPALDARNLINVQQAQWVTVLATPSYATATSFVLTGDLRDTFPAVIRLRLTIAGVDFITEVTSTSFANNITTVNLLDAMPGSQLTAVAVSVFTPTAAGGALTFRMLGGDGFTTGDAKLTFKNVADAGWVLMDDGSIGNAVSGATTRANADTEALYTLLWTAIPDAWAAVSGGRGASAAADFAANKALTLPKALGRALAVAGAGSGLTARALGEYLGAETHALTAAENGPHAHGINDAGHSHTTNTTGDHSHTSAADAVHDGGAITDNQSIWPCAERGTATGVAGAHSHTVSASNANITVQSNGSGMPHNNMQPSAFFNVMVKL